MNYSPFLNKNSKFINNNRFELSQKKKNGKIFLLSAIATVAVISTLFSFIPETDALVTTQQNDEPQNQVSALALPEIGYQSQILSKTVIYTETEEPTAQPTIKAETTDPSANNKIAIDQSVPEAVVADINNDLTQQLLADAPETKQQKPSPQQSLAKIGTSKKPTKQLLKSTVTDAVSDAGFETPLSNIKTITVKKGDTLSAIFKRHSLSSNTLYKIINSGKQAKKLTRIKPGQTLSIALNDKNELQSLKFALNKADTLVINKQEKQFVSNIESKEIEIRQQFTTATINNSLFSAGNKSGLNSAMIMKLAHIFGWDIDFALDIRKGDSFSVLFEEKFIDGKKISDGNILSAEFINQGKVFTAIRYTDESGHTDYYSENGLSMRKAFLRTPVEFSRISSRFSSGRKHPILNRIRAHKGVDYAASRGTPIKAVGDGKVVFKGTKGGYGRVIILQHGSKYTTLYAHMNAYNKKLRHGSRVKQGQTIGYIGSSGLATGPHLHYEFRVNGVHRNPLTVKLPSAAPIDKKYRTDFKAAAETMISQLKLRKQETIALNE